MKAIGIIRNLVFLILIFLCSGLVVVAEEDASDGGSEMNAPAFLEAYCVDCHSGQKPKGKLDLSRFNTLESIVGEPKTWDKIATRLRDREMPPEEADQFPSLEQRDQLVAWIDQTLRAAACADGLSPGAYPIRRLNRDEYAATIRDLLGTHFNAGHALPSDGAGGEGFDNTAETLFLSPLHAEKYLEAAREALDYATSDPKASRIFLIAKPNENTSPEEAAHAILEKFLPRAFRRPVSEEETERYESLFRNALQREETFMEAVVFALQEALVSPDFLFRVEEPNPDPAPRLVPDYELATRLSYFLWGSMPDDELFKLADQGKLNDSQTLKEQVVRMLKDRKAREFAERFIEQWLGTRELGRNIQPDQKLFRGYDDELEWAMKNEPVLFFQEILSENLSLLNLLDSDFSFLNNKLGRLYRIKEAEGQQLKRFELPKDSHRGGVLGMAAVLAVSSYPHRTSPVLRGKWVLETLLGAPPPPPPPDVPDLPEVHEGDPPKTLRERLMRHRENPTCASCHNRMDPIGFGLENYDVIGRWRTEDSGLPIDSKGQLPDGSSFDGPEELKAVLSKRKDDFTRQLTTKMLGYALGRGLTYEDSCTVNQIVEQLQQNDYHAHTLILGIVNSVPFRYKSGTDPNSAVSADDCSKLKNYDK